MCDRHHAIPASSSHSCGCGSGHTLDAATELILPAMTFPSSQVLAIVGEEKLRQLVRRHHALLQASPIAGLFTEDPWAFAKLAEKVADFVVESCGGPPAYTAQHGGTCMRTRHFPFTIDEAARETWLAALFRAMEDVDFPVEVRAEYWDWLEAFSVRMINRRTVKAQPARIPFVMAQLRFAGGGAEGLPCGVGMRFCPHG